jgi:sigma-B regulation protein RsbU (phosphoserine phosphatase)
MGPSSGPSRILLSTAEAANTADVRRPLEQAGHQVSGHVLAEPLPADLAAYHLVVADGAADAGAALPCCRRLRAALTEAFVPILFLGADPDAAARLAGLDAGADACLTRPFEERELLAQVQALLRIKHGHDYLSDKTAEVNRINKRLQQAYQQIDQELELAHRIQMSFLPQSMPELPRLRFAVHYLLCGRVGGDFYDIFRLDENHVGFYVADAMGHGVPASLLAIFVKKGVRAKEIFGKQYRLLPPGEVLQRLNRDLIDQALSEHPFITMVYVLLNFKDGTLQFARAGHPYPLHVPRQGELELWQVAGSLLGVFETVFPVQTRRLQPGDKVLLYSDGIDNASFEDKPPGVESLVACATRHRDAPIQEFLTGVARDLFGQSSPGDDLTLLGVEMLGSDEAAAPGLQSVGQPTPAARP